MPFPKGRKILSWRKVKMSDRWIKRWKVPKSSGDGFWTVAVDKDGNYGCSCPVWKFRRQECHHIILVKNGGGELKEKPKYILAKVLKPVYNKQKNELLIPLIAIPDVCMMEATICFYLFKYGYSLSEVRQIRRIPSDWTMKAIIGHIETKGEAVYPTEWYNH